MPTLIKSYSARVGEISSESDVSKQLKKARACVSRLKRQTATGSTLIEKKTHRENISRALNTLTELRENFFILRQLAGGF